MYPSLANCRPALMLRLGSFFTQFRAYAENSWIWHEPDNRDDAEVHPLFADMYWRLRDDVDHIGRQAPDSSVLEEACRLLRSALTSAFDDFSSTWGGPAHQESIRAVPADVATGSSWYAERAILLLDQSPLSGTSWEEMDQYLFKLREHLKDVDRVMFDLGLRLALSIELPITGRDRWRSGDKRSSVYEAEKASYFNSVLWPKLKSDWLNACKHHPQLNLKPLPNDPMGGRYSVFLAEIQELLCQLPSTSLKRIEYLDLMIDEATHTVYRDSQSQLLSDQGWELFQKLAWVNGRVSTREELTRQDAVVTMGKQALEQAISRLRADLQMLGLTIKCRRGHGWKLVVST